MNWRHKQTEKTKIKEKVVVHLRTSPPRNQSIKQSINISIDQSAHAQYNLDAAMQILFGGGIFKMVKDGH